MENKPTRENNNTDNNGKRLSKNSKMLRERWEMGSAHGREF